jgi:hypothetical protein
MKESFQFFLWNLNNIEFPWSGSRFKSSIPRIIRFFSIRVSIAALMCTTKRSMEGVRILDLLGLQKLF